MENKIEYKILDDKIIICFYGELSSSNVSKYRNLIEVMKSKDYEYLGLHPILDANLQVNAIAINDKSLTFDFSDHLYVENNQEALDIFPEESLSA